MCVYINVIVVAPEKEGGGHLDMYLLLIKGYGPVIGHTISLFLPSDGK